jgi:hypothetical protein
MSAKSPRRWVGVLLWILAVVLMMATAVYQRRTGPTHPARGTVQLVDQPIDYKLIRSETTGIEARIAVEIPPGPITGTLQWRRYPTAEPFTAVPMVREDGELAASLPTQPAAGKLEYRVELRANDQVAVLPTQGPAILRYKGDVPAAVLMFLGLVWGVRTLLELATGRPMVRRQAWTAMGLMLLGGMVLGPAVQHYAFGEAWTGVPFGWDLTDNKTLLMVIAWGTGCGFLGFRGEISKRGKTAMAVAGLIMLAVYLIPHSLFGSTLNYEAVDQGMDPAESIGQG